MLFETESITRSFVLFFHGFILYFDPKFKAQRIFYCIREDNWKKWAHQRAWTNREKENVLETCGATPRQEEEVTGDKGDFII
jgi:hypothetical protein